MFERFTPDGRDVVVRAQELARRLRHDWIGCEHFLLSLVASPTPVGVLFRRGGAAPERVEEAITELIGPGTGGGDERAALATLGIDLDQVRHAVEATFGPGALDSAGVTPRRRRRLQLKRRHRSCTRRPGRPQFTSRAKRCLELSLREALRLKHHYVGVEHIALALLARDDTAAWRVLFDLGVSPADLRRRIHDSLRSTA